MSGDKTFSEMGDVSNLPWEAGRGRLGTRNGVMRSSHPKIDANFRESALMYPLPAAATSCRTL
jgi:hypothetical protein